MLFGLGLMLSKVIVHTSDLIHFVFGFLDQLLEHSLASPLFLSVEGTLGANINSW